MKIIVTGSLGHISKPLTEELAQKGNEVTVVSSKEEKRKDIEALQAAAAIGSVDDVDFLTKTFSGADAVYCMVPPSYTEVDQVAYYTRVANNYVKAVQQSGVKCVVLLSSYGAELDKDTGFILGAHHAEQIMNKLEGVTLTFIRPGYFYYNLLGFAGMIKAAGFIAANYGGDDLLPLVSPKDIAAAIAEELHHPAGNKIRYVVSDDRTCNEIAGALGNAIGKPGLHWNIIGSEQMQTNLVGAGVPTHVAGNLVGLGSAIHSRVLRGELDKAVPALGKIKIEEYANDFAAVYNKP